MREIFRAAIEWALAIIGAHQYVLLFAIIAIEEAGVPLPAPGDLVIAFYGWRTNGDPYEIAQVILACALGSTAGTLAPYWLARRFGHTVALRLAGWLDVEPRHVDALTDRVARGGFLTIFVARLIPGLRVAVSLVSGTARVRPLVFASAVFCAALVYWTAWVMLGVLLGPDVARVVSPAYLRVIVILIPVTVVLAFIARRLYARRKRKRAA